MKVSLKNLNKVLAGVLNGTLELATFPIGKKAKKEKIARAGRPKKRGRKPMPPSAKKVVAVRNQKRKVRELKKALPTYAEIFLALDGKIDGLKLSDLCKKFSAKPDLLKGLLGKLVKKEDLNLYKGKYFLARPIRHKGAAKVAKKEPPVKEADVLALLKKKPATLTEIAKGLGEKTFQRLNRVVSALKKAGKVLKDEKVYRLV